MKHQAGMQYSFNAIHGHPSAAILLRRLRLALAAPLLASCAGNVEVGQAKPDVDEHSTSDGSTNGTATSSSSAAGGTNAGGANSADCADADALTREAYDSWVATPNDVAPLAGKTFAGHIEAGPDLRLTIEGDQTATLVVGQAAPPPEKNSGYLCGEDPGSTAACETIIDRRPIVGATYPLHGATLEGQRFRAPLQDNIPWDPWCALQTPIAAEDDDCFFTPVKNAVTGWGNNGCSLDGASIDCGWLALAELGVCRCTSTQCFAGVYSPDVDVLDARLSDTEHELVGSFRGSTVYLFLESD